MQELNFTVLGVPKPKQSARFRAFKMGTKTVMQSYQTKEVKDQEANIGYSVMQQLPPGHIPWDGPIGVRVKFVFPITTSLSKKKTQGIIHSLGLNSSAFDQGVSFKGQLFIPQGFDEKKIKLLNRKCIIGTYIRLNEINVYAGHTFYIPQKLDWLIAPHSDVKWLSFKDCISFVQEQHLLKRSVMIWIKSKTSLKKCFVVFWN